MISIKSEGLEGADKWMRGFQGTFDDAIYNATFQTVLEIHAAAVQLAPYQSGTLRRSIESRVKRVGNKVTGIVRTRGVPYARIQEFGGITANGGVIAPKYYMTQPFENKTKNYVQRVNRLIKFKNRQR